MKFKTLFKNCFRWCSCKESAGDTRDADSIFESGRYSGIGHGNSLQYCYLENSMNRGTWQAAVCGVTESQTQLSTHTHR